MPTLPQPKPEEPQHPTGRANPGFTVAFLPELGKVRAPSRKARIWQIVILCSAIAVGLAVFFAYNLALDKAIWPTLLAALSVVASTGIAAFSIWKSRTLLWNVGEWRTERAAVSIGREAWGADSTDLPSIHSLATYGALLRIAAYESGPNHSQLNLQGVADSAETPAAAQVVTTGLNDLFGRLGPPPPGLPQKSKFEPSAGGSGGRNE